MVFAAGRASGCSCSVPSRPLSQIPPSDIDKALWAQFGRNCRLTIFQKNGDRTKLDGFRAADMEGFKNFLGTSQVKLEPEKVAWTWVMWGKS